MFWARDGRGGICGGAAIVVWVESGVEWSGEKQLGAWKGSYLEVEVSDGCGFRALKHSMSDKHTIAVACRETLAARSQRLHPASAVKMRPLLPLANEVRAVAVT